MAKSRYFITGIFEDDHDDKPFFLESFHEKQFAIGYALGMSQSGGRNGEQFELILVTHYDPDLHDVVVDFEWQRGDR